MANLGVIIKTATSVLAASAAVLTLLKDNPELTESASKTLEKVKNATRSRNPKQRLEAKLEAVNTCATAVSTEFGREEEAGRWRREAAALRVRADLTWTAHSGKYRRQAMRELTEETATLLDHVNQRLATLTGDQASITTDPTTEATADD